MSLGTSEVFLVGEKREKGLESPWILSVLLREKDEQPRTGF